MEVIIAHVGIIVIAVIIIWYPVSCLLDESRRKDHGSKNQDTPPGTDAY